MATRPEEELIIGRILNDVKRNTTKGNYNASDLNRIESWMEYLKELLNEYGYFVTFTTKTDWEIGIGKPNMTSEINRIKTNLQKLKDAYFVMQSTPEVPSTDRLSINYVEANNIEKIMVDIEFLINNMAASFIYCGTVYCGE
ncbi:MAG: hypothetical protein MJ244_04335 [Clostridia bacterium]|nr:hypothetical protein [Clostridia bacterium]